jgi:hypothetical protein
MTEDIKYYVIDKDCDYAARIQDADLIVKKAHDKLISTMTEYLIGGYDKKLDNKAKGEQA